MDSSIIFTPGAIQASSSPTTSSTELPMINTLPYLEWELPESVLASLLAFHKTFLPDYRSGVVTNYDVDLAKYLTDELSPFLEPLVRFNEYSPHDWQSDNPEGFNIWSYEGVSPFFEFNKLFEKDVRYARYSKTVHVKDDPLIRTMFTGVIFLTTNETAAHALVDDGQFELPYTDRVINNSPFVTAGAKDLISWAVPSRGKLIIYPSKIKHTVLPLYEDADCRYIKFDVFYNALRKDE